ncbi:MAG: response regulator [Bacteroidales bacterium]|jgi:CheY-like chemotaxis protein|nr:response regulator [Bacteroidales bacterium]
MSGGTKKRISARGIILPGITTGILLVIALLFSLTGMHLVAIFAALATMASGIVTFKTLFSSIRNIDRSSTEIKDMQINQGELMAYFSHSIREPLNNLVIIGEMLSETDLSSRQRDMVETLIASTTNMVSTVNEMAMQSAGTTDPERRKPIRFNLVSAIHNTLELFNLRDDAGISYSIESEVKEGVDLIGDPIVIKQIILDILNTLSKGPALPKPGLKIAVRIPDYDGNRLNVTLTFSAASGFITDDPDSDNRSLALKLTEANEGSYSYTATPEGATLSVTLPFGRPESTGAEETLASRRLAELERVMVKKKDLSELSLLLVEDNAINQKITFLTLKPLVKLIDTASNGKEALDKIASANYDVILMDIQMPVMDGLVAAEKIRGLEKSTGRHVPIIAITANAMLGDKERCLSAGMDDYISKPFQPGMLLEKIRKFL